MVVMLEAMTLWREGLVLRRHLTRPRPRHSRHGSRLSRLLRLIAQLHSAQRIRFHQGRASQSDKLQLGQHAHNDGLADHKHLTGHGGLDPTQQ
jgi:hypothetical protein